MKLYNGFCGVINTVSFGQVLKRGISPLGEYMINWFKNKFKKVITPPMPKCAKCGLGAVYEMTIYTHLIDTEEDNKTSIKSRICESCREELRMGFDPHWLPPVIRSE